MIDRLVARFAQHEGLHTFRLTFCGEPEYRATRMLLKQEDAVVCSESEVGELKHLFPLEPITCLFYYDGVFTFLIPEEMRPLLEGLDWDEIEKRRAEIDDAVQCATVCTEFCGVVSLADLHEQYCAWYGHDVSQDALAEMLVRTNPYNDLDFDLWFYDDDMYF